ncbi:hypothetical protein MUK42_13816 [Musa troglodytarum]|nr:hypothetical protein MUK42_13816 [Musa troglodytarum]
MQTNIIDAALRAYGGSVRKLLFLLLLPLPQVFAPADTGVGAALRPIEPTNEWYAVANIASIKMCQAYRIQHGLDAICAVPTNLYGPHDNFHPENSHVLPELLRRFHEAKASGAKQVVVWGTGAPVREFLHVNDLAVALLFLMDRYSGVEREGGEHKGGGGDGEGGGGIQGGAGVGRHETGRHAAEARRPLKADGGGVEAQGLSQGRAGGELQVVLGDCGGADGVDDPCTRLARVLCSSLDPWTLL